MARHDDADDPKPLHWEPEESFFSGKTQATVAKATTASGAVMYSFSLGRLNKNGHSRHHRLGDIADLEEVLKQLKARYGNQS